MNISDYVYDYDYTVPPPIKLKILGRTGSASTVSTRVRAMVLQTLIKL
jgi:hypothetical protein